MNTINTAAEWLTIRESCELLRITRSTLYNYLSAGKLKAGKIGGKRYVNRQSIADALNTSAA